MDLFSSIDIEDFLTPKYLLFFSNYFCSKLNKYEFKKDIIFSKEFYEFEKILQENKLKEIKTDKILENLIIDGAS